MKNLLFPLLIGLILGIAIGYGYGKASITPTSKIVEKDNQGKTIDYLSINDDDTILKNKFDYYALPDSNSKEIPTNLKEFLVTHYPDNANGNTCIETATSCSVDNSEFNAIQVDLNGDGTKEFIVMLWRVCNCPMRGASGNGEIFIIRGKDNTFEVIGELIGNGYTISKAKTNRYNDIVTNFHGSAVTGNETLYKYQTLSNGAETNGSYEEAFSKQYDYSRIKKDK